VGHAGARSGAGRAALVDPARAFRINPALARRVSHLRPRASHPMYQPRREILLGSAPFRLTPQQPPASRLPPGLTHPAEISAGVRRGMSTSNLRCELEPQGRGTHTSSHAFEISARMARPGWWLEAGGVEA